MIRFDPAFLDALTLPSALATLDASPLRRRSRRLQLAGLGLAQTVGTITAISGVTVKHVINGVLTGTAPVTGGTAPTLDISRSYQTAYTYGTSGADTINQIFTFIFTATKNTTTTLDLTGALADIFGIAASTLSVFFRMEIEYLSSTQDTTNGSNSAATATVAINPSASNALVTTPLGAAQIYTMRVGEKWIMERHDSTGVVVTAATGDKLDFVHAVNDYDAKFRITIFGRK